MNNSNETRTKTRKYGNESLEVVYRKAQPLNTQNFGIEFQTPSKIEFKPGSTILKKGTAFFNNSLPLPCDIQWDRDVAVKMRDGTTLYADIFRPVGGQNLPAILSWSPYGKTVPQKASPGVAPSAVSGLQKFEGADPAYWCNHDYAVINVDSRGAFYSEGDIEMWGTPAADDCYDFIEWTAKQKWCSGKVAMSGNSWLGIIQWAAASQNPPHLAAIAPWEGHTDLFRYDVLRGGISDTGFCNFNTSTQIGQNFIEDMPAMTQRYPLMNSYWKDKRPKVEEIKMPAYIVASWGGHQTIDAFRRIAAKDKWLRVHNTGEWPDYYEYADDLRRFYDHFLKGIDNGWEKTPESASRYWTREASTRSIVRRMNGLWPGLSTRSCISMPRIALCHLNLQLKSPLSAIELMICAVQLILPSISGKMSNSQAMSVCASGLRPKQPGTPMSLCS